MIESLKLLNFNGILVSPLNYFITLFFFLGICYLTDKIQKFVNITDQKKFLEFFLLLLCGIVLLINIFLLLRINFNNIKNIFYFIPFLGILFLITKNKLIINYYKYLNKSNSSLIKVFLIIIFFNSILSPMDIDSFDYHLGFPGHIENQGYFDIKKDWFHSAFFFNGEIIGLLGLMLKSDNFLNFLNFISILVFFRTIELSKHNLKTQNIIKLLIVGCPAIIQLTLSSKPFLFPLSIMIFSFYQLKEIYFKRYIDKKYLKHSFVFFIIIFFGASFRYELYIFLFLIILYLVVLNKFYISTILNYSIISFFISIFSIFLRNYIYFSDPIFPFLSVGNLSDGYISFMEGLGSTGSFFGIDKILIFPINLFISTIPEYFITTLGFAIIPLLFHIKKKFISMDLILIIAYILMLFILGKLSYPRFFIPSFLLFIITYGDTANINNHKIFKYILFGHVFFSFFILSYSTIMHGPMLINENFKSNILVKTVDNHYVYKSISENSYNDQNFLDITRSRNHFDKRKLNIEFNENYNYLNNSKLLEIVSNKNKLIIIDHTFKDYLIKNNIKFKVVDEFKYYIYTRNPLFNKLNQTTIIKLNN